jgi:hypothetical protein
LLERSVVFLTRANIRGIIRTGVWLSTVWKLADAYLADIGAERLSTDRAVVGLSEETTCYVTAAYLEKPEPFSDYIVHEAAHVFHNCKRETVGLPATRAREWLLSIDFGKRETFAYACEAYGYLLEHTNGRAERRRLLDELASSHDPGDDRVDGEEFLDILAEAIESRAGWKRILNRCKPVAPQNPSGLQISNLRLAAGQSNVPLRGLRSPGAMGTLRRHGSSVHLPHVTRRPRHQGHVAVSRGLDHREPRSPPAGGFAHEGAPTTHAR